MSVLDVVEGQRNEVEGLLYSDWVDHVEAVILFVVVGSDHLGLEHLLDRVAKARMKHFHICYKDPSYHIWLIISVQIAF